MKAGFPVEELLAGYATYEEGYEKIMKKVARGELLPVKSSGSNGRRPWLYQRYRKAAAKKEDFSAERMEIVRLFPMEFSQTFYTAHLQQYRKDRKAILKLIQFLEREDAPGRLAIRVSANERSFEIWSEEKLLQEQGFRILKNLKADPDLLNVYKTCEPLAITQGAADPPIPLLILENLDPYVSLRQCLQSGSQTILGKRIGSIAYGAGKQICSTFQDLVQFGKDPLNSPKQPILYAGDLDWEGIRIYESLCRAFPAYSFVLFLPAYLAMLAKAAAIDSLPRMKAGQIPLAAEHFFSQFDEAAAREIRTLLEDGFYIPQEILSVSDYLQPAGKSESEGFQPVSNPANQKGENPWQP